MSEKWVIVVGDKTSHGGTVITGDPNFIICEKPAAFLGDKVHCPIHGETTIIEGCFSAMAEPNRTFAYEGCKTSCGAVLIAGGQDVVVVEIDETDQLAAAPINEKNQNIENIENKKTMDMDEEFILFVATVYGEAASQSEVAWRAVASVIMNRVGHPLWKKNEMNKTVTSVIKCTGFDAIHKQKNFIKAFAFLSGEKEALNTFEKNIMKKMIEDLKPIYYEKQVITTANHYYSPNEQLRQHNLDPDNYPAVPKFAKYYKEVKITELKVHDDFKFYYGE